MPIAIPLTMRLLLAALVALAAPVANAASDIGVVLMHGKQAPERQAALAALADQLQRNGMMVARPRMPWAAGAWERIAVTVEAAHAQIDGHVADLRGRGARRIVVAGHSLGANVALSYAVERGNLAGVVMLGPGHSPAAYYRQMADFRAAIEKAGQMVNAGQGAQPFAGPDNNQGKTFTVTTTAEVYLSWMSPRRLASMPAQAPRLPPGIPVLLAIGDKDPSFATAESTIFAPAAKHPYSKFVPLQADHAGVIAAAAGTVADWLQGLPSQ
jgi:pimeloyl-ACP methyl ester carboxylesterase